MSFQSAANQQLVRKTNQNLIIDAMRERGPMSRADLSKILDLSAPAVSVNIEKLLEQGILVEIGRGVSCGGRKPILIEFNYGYGYIVGVDLANQKIRIGIANLDLEIVSETVLNYPADRDINKIVSLITQKIDSMLERIPGLDEKIKVFVVAVPGVPDKKTGYFMMAPQLKHIENVSIKALFEQKFNRPVIVKNDINTAALGESWYGAGVGRRNMVYVSVAQGLGIGAGIIIDGKLHEGCNNAAGEIGFLCIDREALNGTYTDTGYFESKASIDALINNIKNEIKKGRYCCITSMVKGDLDKIDFDMVVNAVDHDSLCSEQVIKMARIVGVAISNLMCILDTDIIIMGGEALRLGDVYINEIIKVTKKLVPIRPRIIKAELGQKAGIYGAFAVGSEYIFNNIIS
ncbi:MAG: ROK family transcriptional regulator [Clostridia bacterium]|nr:ROK family transcriptional regulator [Clostridia bacterium]